ARQRAHPPRPSPDHPQVLRADPPRRRGIRPVEGGSRRPGREVSRKTDRRDDRWPMVEVAKPPPIGHHSFSIGDLSSSEGRVMYNRILGRTGWPVSEIGYGMWGLAGWTGSDDAESLESLHRSIELGCNFFDTAWGYGRGHSESILGR